MFNKIAMKGVIILNKLCLIEEKKKGKENGV
jgi:hypothetical protein